MSGEKSIIILSEKASGSSACQNLLAKFADVRHVARTRHYQNETLYWTKAASVLGLPQRKMVDSEVPIPPARARRDLVELLRTNLDDFQPPADDHELIESGWRSLCLHHAPIFLEKSPHHLCQWSALELILEFARRTEDIDTLLIGLVRNPMATLYSNYREWKSPPEQVERQWCAAYRNLLRLKEEAGDRLVVVRYEDIVTSLEYMAPVFAFCGVQTDDADNDYLHRKSLQRWRKDTLFGHELADETVALAGEFGYRREELANDPHPLWPVTRNLSRAIYKTTGPLKKLIKRNLKKLASGSGAHSLLGLA